MNRIRLLNADAKLLSEWNRFMMIPLSYEIWAFPFRLGFCSPGFNSANWILFTDITCDFFFVVDAFLNLITIIPAGTYSGQEEPVDTLRGVAKYYLKYKFPQLFLSLTTYYAVSLTLPADSYLIWLWWLSTIPKVVIRMSRLIKYFESMTKDLRFSVQKLQAINVGLVILLSSHWVGCILYFLARTQDFSHKTWVYDFEQILPLYSIHTSPEAENYLLCIYKGLNALSTLGYDIGIPNNVQEMLFSLLVMMLQVYLQGLILGTLLNYLVRKDPSAEAHKEHMEKVRQFMTAKQIPIELQERVSQYYEFQYTKNLQNRAGTRMDLPRSLKIKVAEANYRTIMDKCATRGKFMNGCNSKFFNALMTKLRLMHFMPGEEIVQKDEIPREVYFVHIGSVQVIDEQEHVIGVIRNDVPDMAPVVGEVPFFLGINHVNTIKARLDGDVQLLVLKQEDSAEIFSNYPEEQLMISENILRSFDLDNNGLPLPGSEEDVHDKQKMEIKRRITESMRTRAEQQFFSLCHAAHVGDVDTVRILLRQGANIDEKNYDGRTVLHIACAEGNYRMVEVLLNHGADKNIKDRWGNTPLQEAISHKQTLIVGLLTQWKASLDIDNPASALCTAAGNGDLAQVRRLIENGVQPNLGDYDNRTALHVASAEGHEKIVEFLLAHKADPSPHDRWKGTPLQDALLNGHSLVATLLKAKGGSMPQDVGVEEMCGAASSGDLRKLRLMHEYGTPVDVGDYDFRYPLHLAAAEARILAVNFLLGVSADPGCKDRWGGTPLDDTLRGGTLYHRYCGKLIQSWGGDLGIYKDTAEGAEFLQQIDSISIADVRLLIKKLIEKGFDRTSPTRMSEEEMHAWYMSSSKHMELAIELISETSLVTKELRSVGEKIKDLTVDMRKTLDAMLTGTEKVTMRRSISIDVGESSSMELSAARPLKAWNASKTLEATYNLSSLWTTELDVMPASDGRMSSTDLPLLARSSSRSPDRSEGRGGGGWKIPSRLLQECKAAMVDLEKNVGEERDFEYEGELDSDEEMALYEELDQLLEAQESVANHGMKWEKLAAVTFRGLALRLVEMEAAYELVKSIFCSETGGGEGVTAKSISTALERLSASTESVEVEEIIDEAKPVKQEEEGKSLTLTDVLSRSGKLRKLLIDIKIDELTLGLLKSKVGGLLDETTAAKLAGGSKKKYWRKNEVIYDGKDDKKRFMLLLLDGGANMVLAAELGEQVGGQASGSPVSEVDFQLHSGDYFGCYQALTGSQAPFVVRATTDATVVLYVPMESVMEMLGGQTEQGKKDFLCNMSEYVYNQKVLHLVPDFSVNHLPAMHKTRSDRPRTAQPSSPGSPTKFGRASSSSSLQQVLLDQKVEGIRGGAKAEKLPLEERERVRSFFFSLHDLWKKLSLGSNSVLQTHLESIQPFIGESGLQCFLDVFAQEEEEEKSEVVTCEDFWRRWINLLEPGSSGKEEDEDEDEEDAKGKTSHDKDSESRDQDGNEEVRLRGYLNSLRWVGNKKLTNEFGQANLNVWEKEFLQTVGSMSDPIPNHKIKRFLTRIYSERKWKITEYNCEEFRDFFDRETVTEDKLTWSEICKVVREKKSALERSAVFMGSALNPYSSLMSSWKFLMRYVSFFEFVLDPIRIGFLPWSSITSSPELCTRLVPDVLLYLHLLVETNTAYKNSKSVWITDRAKILRKMDLLVLVAVFPLDWFAHFCGASYEVCCWLRLNKIVLVRARFHASSSNLRRYQARNGHGMIHTLGKIIVATLHLSACTWYFLGRSYRYWFPQQAISWNYVSPQFVNETYPRGETIGMEEGSTTWERYLLCFYWVSTTLTVNGAVGALIPQNVVEIGFTIVLMCLNMTLFRVIVGEVSTLVMKKDEDVVKMREQMEVVDSFVSNPTFSPQLKDEIRNHFQAIRSGSSLDQGIIFKDLSHGLRIEVARFISREYLDSVELFKDCTEHMLDDVCVLLCEVSFAPEEHLYNISEVCKEMFFVVNGSVEEVQESNGKDVVENVRRAHQAVGSISFFFGTRHFHTARASKNGAICMKLDRKAFFDLLKNHPKDEDVVAKNALRSFEIVTKSQAGGSSKHSSRISFNSSAKGSNVSSLRSRGRKRSEPSVQNKSEGEEGEETSNSEFNSGEESDAGSGGNEQSTDKISQLKLQRKAERINLLLTAAAAGDLGKVRSLCSSGDVTVLDRDGANRTALHVAASEGHQEMVRFLLEMRADPNQKDNYDNTPVNDAVRNKHDEVVRVMREAIPGIKYSLPGNQIGVELCEAAYAGNVEQVRRLLDNGVNVNDSDYDGRTALHLAACEGHVELVEFLLSRQANVEAQDRFMGTPLEDAVRHHFDIRAAAQVQVVLREHGASLQRKMEEYAAKMCSFASKNMVVNIKVLVENGIEVNTGDYDRRTALHLAASCGSTSVIEFLLSCEGINVNTRDRFEMTPLDDALRHGKKSVAAMLEEAGGKRQEELGTARKDEGSVEVIRARAVQLEGRVATILSNSPESAALRWIKEEMGPSIKKWSNMIDPLVKRTLWTLKGMKTTSSSTSSSSSSSDSSQLSIAYSRSAAEHALQMLSELRHAILNAKNALQVRQSEEIGPIDCVLWKKINKNFEKSAEDLWKELLSLLLLSKVARKFVKALVKAGKRSESGMQSPPLAPMRLTS